MKSKLFLGALTAAMLSACGGGGGSSDSSDSGGSGGSGGSGSAAPTFTTETTASVLEGTRSVLTVEATGAIELTGGADQSKFTLSADNELTFNLSTGFDFESPIDDDADNVYEITFTATEGSESSTLDLAVTVTDAFEGRVIDGPVAGALVFVDVDGDYVQDADELSGTTDSNGLFFVAKGDAVVSASSKLISIGGTDTTTDKQLPNLALASDVPTNGAASAYITPISTVIAAAETPAAKAQVLSSLGVSASDLGVGASDSAALVEAFISKDVWAEAVAGDSVAQAIQTKNVQLTEVLVSAVNVADTSDAATATGRAVSMTKSFAQGLVAQAAEGNAIINTEVASDGTVSFKIAESVIAEAMVVAVQTYTSIATVTDTSLDTLVANTDALLAFATDLIQVVANITDQLNFADITDDDANKGVISAAKTGSEDAVNSLTSAVIVADVDELAAYAAGDVSSTLAQAVATVETTVVSAIASAVAASASSSAQEAADLTNTGYSLPVTISVLETVE